MEAFQPRFQLSFPFAVKFYHGRTRSRAHMHWSPTSWWCSTWSRGRFPSFLSFFFSFIGSTEKLGPSQVRIFFVVSAVNLIFPRMWGEGGGKVEVWRGALRGWGRKWGGRGGGRLAHCWPGENGGEECLLDAGGELWVQFAVFKCLHLTPDSQVLPKIRV